MTLSFSYNKSQVKIMFIGCILFLFVFFRKIFYFNPDKLVINSELILNVFLVICFCLIWLTMLKTPYLKIDKDDIILNLLYTPIKQKFSLSEVEKVNVSKKLQFFPILNSERLSLYLKNGKKKHIYLKFLNEEDQQKVIEIFKEKGLLKE